MTDDLPRWSAGGSGAPPTMQELLNSARQDVPSAAQLSGLEGKLGALLDTPAPVADLPPGPPGTNSMPALTKLAVLVAVGGLVGTGAYLTATRESKPPQPPASAVEVAPPAPTQTDAPEPPAIPAPEPTTQRSAEPEPAEPTAEAPAPRLAPAKPRAATSQPSEASLLNQAQRALKSDPERALALTRQHRRLYPKGTLTQEREVIAIEALSRLDQKNKAQQKAEQFTEKYPDSAHKKKVDTTLEK